MSTSAAMYKVDDNISIENSEVEEKALGLYDNFLYNRIQCKNKSQ